MLKMLEDYIVFQITARRIIMTYLRKCINNGEWKVFGRYFIILVCMFVCVYIECLDYTEFSKDFKLSRLY